MTVGDCLLLSREEKRVCERFTYLVTSRQLFVFWKFWQQKQQITSLDIEKEEIHAGLFNVLCNAWVIAFITYIVVAEISLY